MIIGNTSARICVILYVCTALFSCTGGNDPSVKITDGTTRISGTISNSPDTESELILYLNDPVTSSVSVIKIPKENDGRFSIEIPVQISRNYASLQIDRNNYLTVLLRAGEKTRLKINYNKSGDISVHSNTPLNGYDMRMRNELLAKMSMFSSFDTRQKTSEILYNKNYTDYLRSTMGELDYRIEEIVGKDIHLSRRMKNYLANEFRFFWLSYTVFFYPREMAANFQENNPEEKWTDFVPPPAPPKEYYSFLKDLDLNDPRHMYTSEYNRFLQRILVDKTLNIPPIGDTPVDVWLRQVKIIMSDPVGFDDGLFYDLLVTNSYGSQLTNKQNPLTHQQLENIEEYYMGSETEKILLRKNDEVIKLAVDTGDVVINDTPSVPKENMMEAIISKYEGKVVLVDLWATWCAPCLVAMDKIRPLKKELDDDSVVFVYITNSSSPLQSWNDKIKSIDGEHYYLDEESWDYIMTVNQLSYIPSYLLYDKNGELQEKMESFPGVAELHRKIDSLQVSVGTRIPS